MEKYLNLEYSWANFLFIAVGLFALYFLLKFIDRILSNFYFLGRFQTLVKNRVQDILLIYEAIVLLLLSTNFVLINPVLHGLLFLLLLIGGFTHVKNYISGRIVQFDKDVAIGNQLSTTNLQGIIAETGRLGLRLNTNEGLHFINYSKLINDGYLLDSSDIIGGFYHLEITPKKVDAKINYGTALMDLLATAPYLDWSHKPELSKVEEQLNRFNARVLVLEEDHLYDLITLIRERGYSCTITKQ